MIRPATIASGVLLFGASLSAQQATTIALTSVTPAAPVFGQTVILKAQVTPATAPGSVSFMDQGVLIGTGTVNSSGMAQATTLTLRSGQHSLRAIYGGNSNAGYQASESAAMSYAVTEVPGQGYATAVNYPTPYLSQAEGLGDFNGDGKADLIIVGGGFNNVGTVNVLLGNGDGTFQTAAGGYVVGNDPWALALGDFNGDGAIDVAVVNQFSNNVSILRGNGNGSFQTAVNYPVGSNPVSIAVGDFDRDGKADLVVANLAGANVSVLLGNGDGTFQTAVSYTVGNGPNSIALGDFNGDGYTDLAVAESPSSNVGILLGNGDGTFRPVVNYPAVGNPSAIAMFDFNLDGKADLAVADGYDGYIGILLGNGDGTFGNPAKYPAPYPVSIGIADFNGDGFADLSVTNYFDGNVSVLLGNGKGAFSSAVSYGVSGGPAAIVAGDFNGDGRADLAAACNGEISVLLALGANPTTTTFGSSSNPSTFGQAITLTATVVPSNAPSAVEFLDGTSILGVKPLVSGQAQMVTNLLPTGSNSLKALYSGGPSWDPSQSSAFNQIVNPTSSIGFASAVDIATGSTPVAVAIADLNGDGISDLVVVNQGGTVGVMLGNGNGTFATPVNYTVGSQASWVAVGDFNRDGNQDLAVTGYAASYGVILLFGNGDGTFSTPAAFYAVSGGLAPFVGAADFNNDGIPDLVVLSSDYTNIILGNGDGTFQASMFFYDGGTPGFVAVADLNGDGIPDLVTSYKFNPLVAIQLGNGNGTFQTPVYLDSFGAPIGGGSIAIGDFNGDGKPDLVTAQGPFIGIALGNGDGTFQTATTYPTTGGSNALQLATGDFDGNGTLDVVVSDYDLNKAYVLLGNGNGSFRAAIPYAVGNHPMGIAVGDFNGDGRADVAIADSGGGVSILLGAVPLQFNPVAPCRLVDTRGLAAGFDGIAPFSGPSIAAGGTLTIPVQSATEASTNTTPAPCGLIPSSAQAYSVNLTVVPHAGGAVDYVSLWPAGAPQPFVSTLNDPEGLIVANAAIVPAGVPFGGISVYNAGPSAMDVVIDMNGYFAPPAMGLQFYPVAPCRLVDTRGAAAGFNGIDPFAGPSITAGETLTIPVQSTAEAGDDTTPAPCGVIPSTAQAYSFNLTVVPHAGGAVDYVTLWPSGATKPFVSTLDDPEDLIVANAAIVPAGTSSGGVSVYNAGPSTTDVVIDMNGYFAPPTTALQFYRVAPCRLVDTRGAAAGFNGIAPFSGPSIAAGGTLTIPVQSATEASTNTAPAPCGVIPSSVQAYSINITVVPHAAGAVDYVSLWPAGAPQPIVSTVNDPEGLIVANAAIVPAGASSGGVSVYNAGPSTADVIIDMNGYFAP